MSASSAGKFQDHYIVLGIDPEADSDAIQRAYAQLAQQFNPGNEETGDETKFAAVNQAFEVLSDSALRKEFDKLKGLGLEKGAPKFSGRPFFEVKGREAGLRAALLSILYDRRRRQPFRPSISNRNVEGMLVADYEELTFTMWYLKQRGLIAADDKSSLQITIEGMDYLESHWPSADTVLPFIKPTALMEPAPDLVDPDVEDASAADEASAARGRRGARIVGMLKHNAVPVEIES